MERLRSERLQKQATGNRFPCRFSHQIPGAMDHRSSSSVAAAAQAPPSKEELEVILQAQHLSLLSVLPMVLNAAVELGVLNVFADVDRGTHLSAQEVAARLEIERKDAPAMLDRMLCLLASYEIIACTAPEPRRYQAKPICGYLAKNKDNIWEASINQHKVVLESWFHLKDAVVDGGVPFHKAHGMALFECMAKDPGLNNIFNTVMATLSTRYTNRVLHSYAGYAGTGTLVDVGGGYGASLAMIISKHPTLEGINFDLPHVVSNAPAIRGVEHVGGDMFEHVPRGDAMLLKFVLHNWSDDRCLKLLSNCWESLPENGKVIAVDTILPAMPDSGLATKCMLQLDLTMMAISEGGRERTEEEFESLARNAGFSGFKVACDLTDFHIMEFIK